MLTERLKNDWNAPIYAFFHPVPQIGYKDGRRYHEFQCYALKCKATVRRYLDKGDATSTGNLHKHAKRCWGAETVAQATAAANADDARNVLSKSRDGSVAMHFQVKGKAKVTYSHTQHTKTEAKYAIYFLHCIACIDICDRVEIVRWVTENLRPFSIVSDRGFQSLMKTGRPGYYIPSPSTVSRDVKLVFARSRQRIAAMLRVSLKYSRRNKLTCVPQPETRREDSFCDRCMDITKSSRLCCYHSPPSA